MHIYSVMKVVYNLRKEKGIQMIRNLIIDDNIDDANKLHSLLKDFYYSKNIENSIHIFSEKEIDILNLKNIDFLFLDIELKEKNGLDIGEKIREKNKNLIIIITSNYPQYLVEGYKIEAKRFFIKPIDTQSFNFEMDKIVHHYSENNLGFIDQKISPHKIHYHKIIFIEFLDRSTILHFNNGKEIKTNYPLKYWIVFLNEMNFKQPYKCYLVNLKHVSSITKDGKHLYLSNGLKLPVSRKYRKIFKEQYYSFLYKDL